MNKTVLVVLALLMAATVSRAQISIVTGDMVNAGDTLRFSTADPLTQIDLSKTGQNHSWDFSALKPTAQFIDTFVAVPTSVNTFFTQPQYAAKKPTVGQNMNLSALSAQIPAQFSNVLGLYKNSSAAFEMTALYSLMTIVFDSTDVLYSFPIANGSRDSSGSGFRVDLTSLLGLYYARTQKRVNVVDGWGTLTTPFGSFATVRLVSTVTSRDTLYTDSAGGQMLNLPPSVQYKWLAKGMGEPVMTVTEQMVNGTPVVAQIAYRDSVRNIVSINPDRRMTSGSRAIAPRALANGSLIRYTIAAPSHVCCQLLDCAGRVMKTVFSGMQAPGLQQIRINGPDGSSGAGIYIVRLTINGNGVSYMLHETGSAP